MASFSSWYGKTPGAPVGEHPGKGQRVINSKAATNGSLAVAEGVPRETDPRLEVAKCLVLAQKVFTGVSAGLVSVVKTANVLWASVGSVTGS